MSAEKIGKRVGSNRYIHAALRSQISGELEKRITFAEQESGAQFGVDYNVVRYSETRETISFLSYDSYFDDPFPVLKESCLVNVLTGKVSKRDYSVVNNPPILHRKELFVAADHPSRKKFEKLSRQEERAGLLERRFIGRKNEWNTLLLETGFECKGHRLSVLLDK